MEAIPDFRAERGPNFELASNDTCAKNYIASTYPSVDKFGTSRRRARTPTPVITKW